MLLSLLSLQGSHKNAENSRPINLTTIVQKALESMLKKKIVETFCWELNGFISEGSTVTQLLKFIDNCLQSYVGGVIDAIFIDFARAFDTVPQNRSIGKLKGNAIIRKVLAWIKGFLNNRTQWVRVNREYTDTINAILIMVLIMILMTLNNDDN